MWATWWLWAAAAILLGIGEVLLPSFLLLGFALGAAALAIILFLGGPLAVWLAGSIPLLLLAFSLTSLVAWLALRRVLGVRKNQVKHFDHDIND